MNYIGIRSEDKDWESRVSLSPENIPSLPKQITVVIQEDGERILPFKPRVFSNGEYLSAGSAGGAATQVLIQISLYDFLFEHKKETLLRRRNAKADLTFSR